MKLVVHALEIKQLTLYSTLSTTVTCFGLRVIDLVPTCYYLTSPLFARIALVIFSFDEIFYFQVQYEKETNYEWQQGHGEIK